MGLQPPLVRPLKFLASCGKSATVMVAVEAACTSARHQEGAAVTKYANALSAAADASTSGAGSRCCKVHTALKMTAD